MYMYDATTVCLDDHPCINVSDDQAKHLPMPKTGNGMKMCGSLSAEHLKKWNCGDRLQLSAWSSCHEPRLCVNFLEELQEDDRRLWTQKFRNLDFLDWSPQGSLWQNLNILAIFSQNCSIYGHVDFPSKAPVLRESETPRDIDSATTLGYAQYGYLKE